MQDHLLHIDYMVASSLSFLTAKRHQLAFVVVGEDLHFFEFFLFDQGTVLTFCSSLSLALGEDLVVSDVVVLGSAEGVLYFGVFIVWKVGHGQAEEMAFVLYLFIVV